MTTRYIVTYDICDPKRLRKVFEIMKSAGRHLQLSVFRCDLSELAREKLVSELSEVIHAREDQVLLIDLGPAEGRAAEKIRALGRPYHDESREPLVV
jgi:CRISPR-associated protein Cas2